MELQVIQALCFEVPFLLKQEIIWLVSILVDTIKSLASVHRKCRNCFAIITIICKHRFDNCCNYCIINNYNYVNLQFLAHQFKERNRSTHQYHIQALEDDQHISFLFGR